MADIKEAVVQALRISDAAASAFETEIENLIDAALLDLGIAGVEVPTEYDALVIQAVITYCKMSFGLPEDAERLKRAYDEQKAQLITATGYTDWLGGDSDV